MKDDLEKVAGFRVDRFYWQGGVEYPRMLIGMIFDSYFDQRMWQGLRFPQGSR
jgi:hypothetical protein